MIYGLNESLEWALSDWYIFIAAYRYVEKNASA